MAGLKVLLCSQHFATMPIIHLYKSLSKAFWVGLAAFEIRGSRHAIPPKPVNILADQILGGGTLTWACEVHDLGDERHVGIEPRGLARLSSEVAQAHVEPMEIETAHQPAESRVSFHEGPFGLF